MPVAAPIVLVHGLLGFSEIPNAPDNIDAYFRGVRDRLNESGNKVPLPPRLNPAGSIADRALALKNWLETEPDVRDGPFHLMAHSMGGLDSRYLISRLGLAERVLSLTTIGTPHRGSPIADIWLDRLSWGYAKLQQFGWNVAGFADLTTAAAAQFNAETPDVAGVSYFSVAGDFTPAPWHVLRLPHDRILKSPGEAGGPNDGLVSVTSARWGTFLGVWPVDHFRLVNWPSNLLLPPRQLRDESILERYEGLVDNLVSRGFGTSLRSSSP